MAFDGILTKKIIEELKGIIGYKVDKIYQPNKNTVIIGLYKSGKNISLLSCIDAKNYRIHLSRKQYENPIIAPSFCMLLRKHLIGLKIKSVDSNDLERIAFFEFENLENPNKPIIKKLIIELMGKHSNIILTNENGIILDSIRHSSIDDNAQRDIYPTTRYILPNNRKYNFLDVKSGDEFYKIIESLIKKQIKKDFLNVETADINNFDLDRIISDGFNGISYSLLNSIINNKSDLSEENIKKIYSEIIKIINTDNSYIDIICDKEEHPIDYRLCLGKKHLNEFELNYSLDDFYSNRENNENFKNKKNSLLNIVSQTLKKHKKRLENINKKLEECHQMDKYKLYGELITSNLYKAFDKNLDKIYLENYYDNNNLIEIPLDKKYSLNYNAKKYYKKYSKLKNALHILNIQKHETEEEIDYIESVFYEINNSATIEELMLINDEIFETEIFIQKNNKNKKKKNVNKINKKISFNPLKIMIQDYTIYVGRNNKENDYLTTKFADKNDIWFHTKDIPGSHVILKTHPKEIVPEEILIEVAKIAASHSKAKNSSNVPVDYCSVLYVRKPNGSKPGYVIYKNNNTINV